MPEWLPWIMVVVFLTGLACWVVSLALAVLAVSHGAARLARRFRPNVDDDTDDDQDEPDARQPVFRPCHTTRCAHISRWHDVTASGQVCRRCGHTVPAVL